MLFAYRSARNRRCAAIKIASTPPYSPNALVKLADFLAGNPSWGYFPGHRGDFWISPWMPRYRPIFGLLRAQIRVQETGKNCSFFRHISASKMKFKNRLGAPESIAMMSFSPKNQPIRPRRLGSRGGVLVILMAAHLLFRALLYFWGVINQRLSAFRPLFAF